MTASGRHVYSRAAVATWAAWVTCSIGCMGRSPDKWRDGLPPAIPVTGTVSYKGKPLGQATVVFLAPVPGKNRSLAAVGVTDPDGRFVLRTFRDHDGAIAGLHRVTIHKSITVSPGDRPLVPNERGDILDTPVVRHLIPQKYSASDTSGLTAEVSPEGDNGFSFTLEE